MAPDVELEEMMGVLSLLSDLAEHADQTKGLGAKHHEPTTGWQAMNMSLMYDRQGDSHVRLRSRTITTAALTSCPLHKPRRTSGVTSRLLVHRRPQRDRCYPRAGFPGGSASFVVGHRGTGSSHQHRPYEYMKKNDVHKSLLKKFIRA